MDLGLAGKSAAVMAASDGLGKAAARALAREGCDVAICGRNEEKLHAAAKEIGEGTARRVVPIVADVSRAHDVERFVNAAAADLRGLDILVVNAGGPPPGRFEDLSDAQWQAAFDLTLMSAVRAIRAALPHFRAEHGGSVVGIGSTSVKQPIDNLLLSNSIRMSVAGLFKTLALDYAREGIRFNLVLPGTIATDRSLQLARARAAESGATPEAALAERAKPIPLGRLGQPDEIGDAVAWLASDRARYVTGVALAVDGGIVRTPL
ncbi:MAG: 3-oxoacyl-[acyl-carrier protein] reductase [Thermoplasmata archaeon]|jgi:3-oxoacyl-[acyl-carrier protein] reductase|nr:3-oxoacyl-[acyl-carrier protein] reductase [Thermoplasmata archaeon]